MENAALIGNSLVFLGVLIIFAGFLIFALGNFFGTQPAGGWNGYSDKDRSFERNSIRSRPFERRDSFEWRGPAGQDFERESTYGYSAEKKPSENNPSPKIKGGGVIMLGPIPIVFGSDGDSAKSAIILAIILTVLAFFMFR